MKATECELNNTTSSGGFRRCRMPQVDGAGIVAGGFQLAADGIHTGSPIVNRLFGRLDNE